MWHKGWFKVSKHQNLVMKKAFIVALLFAFCAAMVAAISISNTRVTNLSGGTWKFKAVNSNNVSTAHYLATIYRETKYQFAKNNTYTGTFFELPIVGTWEVSADTLVLNKNTYKEEVYTFVFPSQEKLILLTTEKNSKVIIEFEKEKE
jgi:hypothetical protein